MRSNNLADAASRRCVSTRPRASGRVEGWDPGLGNRRAARPHQGRRQTLAGGRRTQRRLRRPQGGRSSVRRLSSSPETGTGPASTEVPGP
jgi:hypothetical protein